MNICTSGIDEAAPCGAARNRMTIRVCGIADADCFGVVTCVTTEYAILFAFPDVQFRGRHVVPLRGRAPPVRKNNPIRITIGAAG